MWKQILSLLGLYVYKPKLTVYTYGYLRYPFDTEQRFHLDAVDMASADEKARQIIKGYIDSGHMVMRDFWRIEKK